MMPITRKYSVPALPVQAGNILAIFATQSLQSSKPRIGSNIHKKAIFHQYTGSIIDNNNTIYNAVLYKISVTHLTMQAQYQLYIYVGHKRHFLANNIFLQKFSFSSTQNVLNIGTVKRAPARVDNLIRADIRIFF